jgi:hypothetical protein
VNDASRPGVRGTEKTTFSALRFAFQERFRSIAVDRASFTFRSTHSLSIFPRCLAVIIAYSGMRSTRR